MGKIMKKVKKRAGHKARREPETERVLSRGLAANLDERKILLAWGLKENEVYTQGQGAESIAECLWSFRGRPGQLVIVSDLRIFGDTKAIITMAMADLFARKIEVRRLMPDGEITNPHVLVKQAHAAIANNRFTVRGRAKREGAKGGAAKGFGEKARRDALCSPVIVRRLVAEFGIRMASRLLGGAPFSRNTLNRYYT